MKLAYVADERDPVDAKLDELLALWHDYTTKYRHERTYNMPAQAMDYRSPTHHDWRNEEIGHELVERNTARRVGECIHRLEQPWQTAIVIQARNLATGHDVWFSPRLPVDRAEREVILIEARNKLMVELRREGIMS